MPEHGAGWLQAMVRRLQDLAHQAQRLQEHLAAQQEGAKGEGEEEEPTDRNGPHQPPR